MLLNQFSQPKNFLPRANLAMLIRRDPATGELLPDSIGLPIETLYPLVDPALRTIISADGGTTKRDDADIVTAALESPLLNYGTMFGRDVFFVAIYQLNTPSPILSRAAQYARSAVNGSQFQNGEIIQFEDASPMEF